MGLPVSLKQRTGSFRCGLYYSPEGLFRWRLSVWFCPLYTLSCTKNFTASVLVGRDCRRNIYVFKLCAPIGAQKNPIRIDIRIASALQRAVSPILHADIHLLVQFTDSGGRNISAPHRF